MENDIIRKLRKELEAGISTESQVVYVLVKIRRLLDLERDEGLAREYMSLRLCCNWAVHVKLSHRQAQKIVEMVDALYPKLVRHELVEKEKNEMSNMFSLRAFRQELNDFLGERCFRTLSDTEWNVFLACFLNTIEDCPLVCEAKEAKVTDVDQVVLIKEVGDNDRIPDGKPPQILWALSLKGAPKLMLGQNFTLSGGVVEALTDLSGGAP